MSIEAYEIFNNDAQAPALVLCDHASNHVPPSVSGGDLGLDLQDMNRHIAYDIGARGTALALAEALDAAAILSRFSRLVIDPNRGDDDPTQVMRLYDGTLIPANARLTTADMAARRAAFTTPYHAAISARIEAQRPAPALISVHTFTPKLRGRPPRPWHVGVLYASDTRMADPLLAMLARQDDFVVGDNEPYDGALKGDCMDRHGLTRALPHVLIEVRNDLVDTQAAQKEWGARLAGWLGPIIDEVITDQGGIDGQDHANRA